MASTFSKNFERYFLVHSKSLLTFRENNETWELISKALLSIIEISTEQDGDHPDFVNKLKPIIYMIQKYILSDRTVLSYSAVKLVTHLSKIMKKKFAPFVQPLIPAIIETLGRTNVLFRNRAFECLTSVIKSTQLPSLVPLICSASTSKSAIVRPFGVKLIEEIVDVLSENCLHSKHALIETAIKTALSDPKAEIRSCARSIFWVYIAKLPDRESSLSSQLPREIFKYLSQDNKAIASKSFTISPISTQGSQAPTAHSSPISSTCLLSRHSSTSSSFSHSSKSLKTKVINHKGPDLSKVKSKVFSHLTTKPKVTKTVLYTAPVARAPVTSQPKPLSRNSSLVLTKADKSKPNFIQRNMEKVKNLLNNSLIRSKPKTSVPLSKTNLSQYKKSQVSLTPSLITTVLPKAPIRTNSVPNQITSNSAPNLRNDSINTCSILELKSSLSAQTLSSESICLKRQLDNEIAESGPSLKKNCLSTFNLVTDTKSENPSPSAVESHKDIASTVIHSLPVKEATSPHEPTPASDSIRSDLPPSSGESKEISREQAVLSVIKPKLTNFGTKPFLFRNRVKPRT